MRKQRVSTALVSATALACCIVTGVASGESRRTFLGANVSAGLGAAVVPEREGADSYEGAPALYLRMDWNNRYLVFRGNELESNLINHSLWRAGPVLNFRRNAFAGASGKPVNQLRGDGDAIELGFFGGFEGEKWDANLQVVKDINGGHKGYLTTLMGGYTMGLGAKTKLRLGAASTYGSGNYMGSYFGIDRANSIRSGINTYNADNGIRDVGANATMLYSLSSAWTLSGHVSYQLLVSDAEDSPVVDDEGSEHQFLGAFTVIYNF